MPTLLFLFIHATVVLQQVIGLLSLIATYLHARIFKLKRELHFLLLASNCRQVKYKIFKAYIVAQRRSEGYKPIYRLAARRHQCQQRSPRPKDAQIKTMPAASG